MDKLWHKQNVKRITVLPEIVQPHARFNGAYQILYRKTHQGNIWDQWYERFSCKQDDIPQMKKKFYEHAHNQYNARAVQGQCFEPLVLCYYQYYVR